MKKFTLLSVALVFLSSNYSCGMETDEDAILAAGYVEKFFDTEYGFKTKQFNEDAFLKHKNELAGTENAIAGFSIHRMHFGSTGDVLRDLATYDHIEGTQHSIVNMVEAGKKDRMNKYHRVLNWKAPKKERGDEQGSYTEAIIVFHDAKYRPIKQELSKEETDNFYKTAAIAFYDRSESYGQESSEKQDSSSEQESSSSSSEEESPKKEQPIRFICHNGMPGYPGYVSQKDKERVQMRRNPLVSDALFLKQHLFYYLTNEHGPKYFQKHITAQFTAKLKVREIIKNYKKVSFYQWLLYKSWLSGDPGDYQWGLKLQSGEIVGFQDRWSLFCNGSLRKLISIARSKGFEGYENTRGLVETFDFSNAIEK